jgi:hypothetical protein
MLAVASSESIEDSLGWLLLTQVAVPFIAILASGILAIGLQRADHRRQDKLRRHEEETRREADLVRRKSDLVVNAAEVHKQIIALGYEHKEPEFAEVMRLMSLTLTEWGVTQVPDAKYIMGGWIYQKRMIAVDHVIKAPPGLRKVQTLQAYFMDVQMILDKWLDGSLSSEWFLVDLNRLTNSESTIAEEKQRYDELLEEREQLRGESD